MAPWKMYLFQYFIGSVLFFIGLILCLKAGDIDMKNKSDRSYVIVSLAGLFIYAGIHGLWTWLALQ